MNFWGEFRRHFNDIRDTLPGGSWVTLLLIIVIALIALIMTFVALIKDKQLRQAREFNVKAQNVIRTHEASIEVLERELDKENYLKKLQAEVEKRELK